MEISTATLSGEWEVDVVPLGRRLHLKAGLEDDSLRLQCNSWCATLERALDSIEKKSTAAVSVEVVHLAGTSDVGTFTISMHEHELIGAIVLDKDGTPDLSTPNAPNFWLEGRMTIKMRLDQIGRTISLVSRQPILQAGRAMSWPPYETVMKDVSGPNEYVMAGDEAGPAVLVLWSGQITIGPSASPFLAADVPVESFRYLENGDAREVAGVELTWRDARKEVPLIDHYHLYRREHGAHGASSGWTQVGGHIKENRYLDAEFKGTDATTYKVRQIFIDALGDEVMGCGSEMEFTVPARPYNLAHWRRERAV